MVNYSELDECVKVLEEVYPSSPKFAYYRAKLEYEILKALEEPNADREILSAYDSKRLMFGNKKLDFDIYRIFTQYKRMKEVGKLIINEKNLRGILTLRSYCSELSCLNNGKVINLLTNPKFIYEVIEDNLKVCRDAFNKGEESKDFFVCMHNVYLMLFNLITMIKADDVLIKYANEYFEIRMKCAENNKEFYNRNFDEPKVKESSAFSKGSESEEGADEDYLLYYNEVFVIKTAQAFLTDLTNFTQRKIEIFKEIDELNLSDKSKDFIKVGCSSCVVSKEPNYPLIIYDFHHDKQLKNLCFLRRQQLLELNSICIDVVNCFNKEALIETVYAYAKIAAISKDSEIYGSTTCFLNYLEYMMDLLIEFNVMYPSEKDAHLDNLRKAYEGVQ